MRIAKQGFKILSPSGNSLADAFVREAKLIEIAGRISRGNEGKIDPNSYDKYIRGLTRRGDTAALKFGSMAVKFTTDQGVSHELARHELGAFAQEDIWRCNYDDDKFGRELTVIKPSEWDSWPESRQHWWKESVEYAEFSYLLMVRDDMEPREARSVLPNGLKTEVVARADFIEWRRVFRFLAISKTAHPDVRALMLPLYEECGRLLPCVFDMGEPE
jgi:thymidylate synthase (FAD)